MDATKQMEQEIQDAISKSLPAHVGSLLAARLALIPELESSLTSLKTTCTSLRTERDSLKEVCSKLEATLKAHDDITNREKSVSARESKMELEAAQKSLEAEKRVSAATMDMMRIVFKNPVYQESHFGSNNQNNGSHTSITENVSKSVSEQAV